MGLQTVNTPFPAVNNRLFPSVGATSAAPGDVVPENGNGLGYFAQPPPGGYRIPGTMAGLGAIVQWPRIQYEWDLIQKENWDNPTTGMGVISVELSDDTQMYGTSPVYSPITAGDPEFEGTVKVALERLAGIIPYDQLYGSGGVNAPLVYASTIQNYWGPSVANDPRVVDAVAKLGKRYTFVKTNFPGVTVLPAGSTLPSGSSARAPIIIDYLDGTYAYAPGYGPVSQYGALQVASPSVPASPRVNAYTGQTVGTASPGDIQGPLVGPTPGSGTWGGVGPGPGGAPDAPPPPSNYPGPLVTTTGTTNGTGATGGGTDASLIPGVSNTMLLAGGGFLVLILAMGGRR